MQIDYIIAGLVAILCFTILKKYFFRSVGIKLFSIVYTGHLISGIFSYLYFTFYLSKPLDMLNFLNDARICFALLESNPSLYFDFFFWMDSMNIPHSLTEIWHKTYFITNSGALQVIKIHVLLFKIFDGNIWVNVVVFQTIVMMAFGLIFKGLKANYKLLIFTLFPGLMFWFNSMLKESLVLFALGCFVYALSFSKIRHFIALIMSLIILYLTRNYMAVLLLYSLVLVYVVSKFKWSIGTLELILIALLGLSLSSIWSNEGFIDQLVNKWYAFDALPKGGSNFNLFDLGSKAEVLYTFLLADEVAIFRPFSFNSMYMFVLSIENILVLLICTFCFIYFGFKPLRLKDRYIIVFSFLVLFVIGFVVRNDGALYRYKSSIWMLLTLTFFNRIDFSLKRQ